MQWAQSPSTRRAWVEIFRCGLPLRLVRKVALYAEGVGRNLNCRLGKAGAWGVALYAEGVGRNGLVYILYTSCIVALYAEGVGRNPCPVARVCLAHVALYTEGVGRNWNQPAYLC